MDEACVAAIPAALTARAQWVVWRMALRGGTLTQVPFRADGGGEARADDPATWAPFAQALAACRAGRFAGVGFVFSERDPFAGLDLGDCRDPATGEIAPWARALLDRLDTYCEVSPSGTGVRAWARAARPGPRARRAPHFEMYDRGRCCAVTGRRLAEYPAAAESRQATYSSIYEHIFAQIPPARLAPCGNTSPPLHLAAEALRAEAPARPGGVLSGGVSAETARRTARKALAWLERAGVGDFTRRDAQRALSVTAGEAGAALALLAEAGRLRALPPPPADVGRPPSPSFRVNPPWGQPAGEAASGGGGGDG